jgi:hypothetical protein
MNKSKMMSVNRAVKVKYAANYHASEKNSPNAVYKKAKPVPSKTICSGHRDNPGVWSLKKQKTGKICLFLMRDLL